MTRGSDYQVPGPAQVLRALCKGQQYHERQETSIQLLQTLITAARAGDAEAQYILGTKYLVARSDEGLHWIQKAAEADHPEAHIVLGLLHYFVLEKPDPVISLKWITLAVRNKPLWRWRLWRRFVRVFMSRSALARADELAVEWRLNRGHSGRVNKAPSKLRRTSDG